MNLDVGGRATDVAREPWRDSTGTTARDGQAVAGQVGTDGTGRMAEGVAGVARVRVRYWAAARAAAAGVPEEDGEGRVLADVLDAAAERHGPELARVLARCSFLVDEVRASRDTALADGAVIDVLPPFAGGSTSQQAAVARERAAPGLLPALLALVVGGALAGAAAVGLTALAVAVGAVQLLIVAAWFSHVGVPGGTGGRAVAAVAVVTVDTVLVARDTVPALAPLAWVLGPAVVVAIVAQLLRRDGRAEVVASLTATIAGAVLALCGSALLPVLDMIGGEPVVVATITAASLAAALGALGGSSARTTGLALLVSVATGAAVASSYGLEQVEGTGPQAGVGAALGLGGWFVAVLAGRLVRSGDAAGGLSTARSTGGIWLAVLLAPLLAGPLCRVAVALLA